MAGDGVGWLKGERKHLSSWNESPGVSSKLQAQLDPGVQWPSSGSSSPGLSSFEGFTLRLSEMLTAEKSQHAKHVHTSGSTNHSTGLFG